MNEDDDELWNQCKSMCIGNILIMRDGDGLVSLFDSDGNREQFSEKLLQMALSQFWDGNRKVARKCANRND